MLQNFGSNMTNSVTVCTEQDHSHINLCTRPKKNQKSDSYEREKAKKCQLPPKAGYVWYFELNYCVVEQEENTAVLRSVSFRLGTECLELSIFCTLKHRRVQKRVHYFCRGYAPSTTSASLFLPWPRSFWPHFHLHHFLSSLWLHSELLYPYEACSNRICDDWFWEGDP